MIFSKIKKEDITIIVQGAVISDITGNALKSVRKHFRESHIILSTWENSNTEGLEFDEIVYSPEPMMAIFNTEKNEYNHTNYQLVSTQRALEKVKTMYCLKLRTDCKVESDNILNFWDKYTKRSMAYSFFAHKIIISSVYTRDFFDMTGVPMPFHPSDIFLFGLTDDLKDYFINTPLMSEKELGDWTTLYSQKKPLDFLTYRYCAEQYYCFSWVKRHYKDIKFDDWSDWNAENIEFSKKILINNFIILDYSNHKINSYNHRHKKSNKNTYNIAGLLTNKLYEKMYKEYSSIKNDISVIVQGAADKKKTLKCLKRVKKNLPSAEIILSTWEGSDVSYLEKYCNRIVLNKDPGATVFDDKENKYNNLNRILVSSQNGINAATRKYVLRLRSDLALKNDNILKLADDFSTRNPEKSLFKQRIFAYEIFSIKYDIKNRNKQRMLFHISDWCYFGLKEDLQELFSIPLVHEPDFSRYFETHNKTIDDIHSTRLWKMSPEQYITSENAKKVFQNLKFDNYLDITDENIKISENFIINNFRVFTPKEWGISILKEEYKTVKMHIHSPFIYYSRTEQLKDYKKYCDNTIETTEMQFLQKLYDIKYFEALRKHFISFIYCKPIKKISEFISTMTYLFKFLFSLIKELIWKQK